MNRIIFLKECKLNLKIRKKKEIEYEKINYGKNKLKNKKLAPKMGKLKEKTQETGFSTKIFGKII